MPNPFGENGLFNPEPEYGAVAQAAELTKAAPISGAPIPGAGTTAAPATPSGPAPVPAGPMSTPFTPAPSGQSYYQMLANTWRAIAATPGASDQVRAIARSARARVRTEQRLSQ